MRQRPYQLEQLECTKKDLEAGNNRLLVVAATGTGKTVYFSSLPKFLEMEGQMFVLVHREELAEQAADKISKWNPMLKVGIEMGDSYADVDSDVVVASVATLGKAGSKRIERFDPGAVSCIVTDEAHHSTASTYMNIYDYFGMFAEGSHKALIGVTATPNRADGVALAKVYSKITHTYSMRQAIEDGWLSDIRAIRLRTRTDISGVKTTAGDFQIGELSNAINNPKRNQQIVKAWLDNAKGLPTIGFTADIQHAKDLAKTFEHYGVKAQAVWGDDPERKQKFADHKAGVFDVLLNCGIATEGYDDPRIQCVIMARPTKSQTLYIQCVGRGTRLQEGIGNLKEALAAGWAVTKKDCLVIDVVDITSRQSLVSVPSLFGMSTNVDLKGKSAFDAVKKLEKAQSEHPEIDFSELDDLDKIDATIEEANIWDVKFAPEVTENSTLGWHRAWDGSYVIMIPSKKPRIEGAKPPAPDELKISANTLGTWDIFGAIEGTKYRGNRPTLEEAFRAADNLLMQKAADALNILQREAEWHDEPMTDSQGRMLKRLLKGKALPPNLKKGQASKLISSLIAGKFKGKAA